MVLLFSNFNPFRPDPQQAARAVQQQTGAPQQFVPGQPATAAPQFVTAQPAPAAPQQFFPGQPVTAAPQQLVTAPPAPAAPQQFVAGQPATGDPQQFVTGQPPTANPQQFVPAQPAPAGINVTVMPGQQVVGASGPTSVQPQQQSTVNPSATPSGQPMLTFFGGYSTQPNAPVPATPASGTPNWFENKLP